MQQLYPHTGPGRPVAPQPPPAAAAAQAPPQELTKTATIRNSVNLKKNTLRLVPVAGDPQKLRITFSFDNSAPCMCAAPCLRPSSTLLSTLPAPSSFPAQSLSGLRA